MQYEFGVVRERLLSEAGLLRSEGHLVSLLDDLLELSKVET